ncbi:hypothetical protein NDU88_003487 [Pleurodeles waltl]|uniref:Uncharacterized protein n=1 Tax=Pleurodeles waltl TaxID=8319 RepID=A0AAV7M3I2_PLEWA|nr:hypothetical protein NDU88_003487 [Pleurodeles waltl]
MSYPQRRKTKAGLNKTAAGDSTRPAPVRNGEDTNPAPESTDMIKVTEKSGRSSPEQQPPILLCSVCKRQSLER